MKHFKKSERNLLIITVQNIFPPTDLLTKNCMVHKKLAALNSSPTYKFLLEKIHNSHWIEISR